MHAFSPDRCWDFLSAVLILRAVGIGGRQCPVADPVIRALVDAGMEPEEPETGRV